MQNRLVEVYDLNAPTTDPLGAATQATRYNAFGLVERSSGASTNNRLANTKERDGFANTALDNHGFRYYEPAIGRYLTRDPLGLLAGLNCYIYAEANPVNKIDPVGLRSKKAIENDLTNAKTQLDDLTNETAKEMYDDGYTPKNPKYSGSFGSDLEDNVASKLDGKKGWYTNVHVNQKTGEIVNMGPNAPTSGHGDIVQVDAIYSAEGKLKVGDKLNPESSIVLDLKANKGGYVERQQRVRLNAVAGSRGAHRIHSPLR